MDADGTNVRRLDFSPGEDRGTSWSPDGSRIVFHSARDPGREGQPGHHGAVNFEIYVMNADGNNQTNISNSPFFDAQPDWSPDGSTIMWNSTRDSLPGGVNFEIYAMTPDGTDVRRLTTSVGEDSGPQWSPNGREISFQSRRHDPNGPQPGDLHDEGQRVERHPRDHQRGSARLGQLRPLTRGHLTGGTWRLPRSVTSTVKST